MTKILLWTIIAITIQFIDAAIVAVPEDSDELSAETEKEIVKSVNETVTLRCPEKNNIVWSFEDGHNQYTIRSVHKPHLLKLSNLSSIDQGIYKCFSAQLLVSAYNLTIYEPPHFVRAMQSLRVKPAGSMVELDCRASGKPTPNITWLKDDKVFEQQRLGKFYPNVWALRFREVTADDKGDYKCILCNTLGCIDFTYMLDVVNRSPNKPQIIDGYPKNVTALVNSAVHFECPLLASVLKRYIQWLYINSEYEIANDAILSGKGKDLNNSEILEISNVTHDDEGWYVCNASNSLGHTISKGYLSVKDYIPVDTEPKKTKEKLTLIPLAITSTVILLFLFFCIYHVKRIRSEKVAHRRAVESAKAEITAFWIKKVVIEKIADSSGDVVDPLLLPVVKIEKQRTQRSNHINQNGGYEFPIDLKWEIQREKILLGKTLGEGAFGIVYKAEAVLNPHTQCTVAVKMLKDDHSENDVKDLVSEMEILKMIGHHCNIVKLIGCCTQGGPLYVVVEYAPYGNLKDFLRQRRSYADTYVTPISNPNEEKSTVTQRDYEEKSTLTQRDLVCFAYQVAKGMEYLSSRRCIHRDLAARNIIVSDNYILKITDFGLARDIRTSEYYKKKTNGLLPVKWMAPEALFDNTYTIKSDVWSYGILLWEIMSFGGTPYPSISSLENLYDLILKGHRMDQPPGCSLEIYTLMCDCWCLQPNERPVFSKIVEDLGRILVTISKHDYLDLVPPQPDKPNQELDCK